MSISHKLVKKYVKASPPPTEHKPRGHTGVCGCGHEWHEPQRESAHVRLVYKLRHVDRESDAAWIFHVFICIQTEVRTSHVTAGCSQHNSKSHSKILTTRSGNLDDGFLHWWETGLNGDVVYFILCYRCKSEYCMWGNELLVSFVVLVLYILVKRWGWRWFNNLSQKLTNWLKAGWGFLQTAAASQALHRCTRCCQYWKHNYHISSLMSSLWKHR